MDWIIFQAEPTFASLPYWSIVVLVGAVSALFTLVVKVFNDQIKVLRERNTSLQTRLDKISDERLEEQKKTVSLMAKSIDIIDKYTTS